MTQNVANLYESSPKNGGGLSENLGALDQPHDIIQYSVKTKPLIFDKYAPLYEKGMSIREIARKLGVPKTTVRESLISGGMSLRNFSVGKIESAKSPAGRRPGVPPFGYGWLEGQLVRDPREYTIVLEIMRLWQEGMKVRSITERLNKMGAPSRNGGKWRRSVVKSIIAREKLDKSSSY